MPNIPDKVDNAGQFLFAQAEWNPFKNSLQNTITDAGGTLIGNDEIQFRQAVNSYASIANFYIDTGTASEYVLNPQGSFKAPVDTPTTWNGMLIRFRPTNTNTGVATLKLAGLNGGLAFNILREDGTLIQAGDISTTRDAILRYSQSLSAFILLNSNLYAQLNANTTNITASLQAQQRITLSYNSPTVINYSAGGFIFDDFSGSGFVNAGSVNITTFYPTPANNTTYHVFAVYNPATNVSQVIIDANFTNPTPPSGFTKKKWIMAIYVNSSGIIEPFKQDGKTITFSQVFVYNSTAITTTPTNLTLRTPWGLRVKALLRCGIDVNTGGSNSLILKDKITGWIRTGVGGDVSGVTEVYAWCLTDTISQIQHYKSNTSPLDAYFIMQDGWEIPDNLY